MLGTEQSSVRAGWSCFINFKDRQLAPTCHPSVRFGPLLSREPVTWLTVRRPCLQDAVLTDPHFIAPFSFQIHWGPTGKTGGFLEWRQRPSGCQTVIDLAYEPGVSSSIVYLEGAGMEHCPWQRFGYHEMRVTESSLGWLWVFPADSVWTTQVKFVLVSRLNIEQR